MKPHSRYRGHDIWQRESMYRDNPRRVYEYAITPRDDNGIIEPDWDHGFLWTSIADAHREIDQIGV
ncbi:MAG: hypothetical protein WC977_10725 [Anaerovoracaceae bacterium]